MVSGIFGAASVGLAAGAVVDGGWTGLAAWAGAAVALASAVHTMMVRVEVHPGQVVLVNWLRVVRLPWSEIERFDHDQEGLWVRRRNGIDAVAPIVVSEFREPPCSWRDSIGFPGGSGNGMPYRCAFQRGLKGEREVGPCRFTRVPRSPIFVGLRSRSSGCTESRPPKVGLPADVSGAQAMFKNARC